MSSRQARRAWAAAQKKHLKPGAVFLIDFRHDPWCAIYTPARLCNCNPDRVLMDESRKVLAVVEGVGPYDPLEFVEAAK